MSILQILEDIGANSKKSHKQALIKNNSTNSLFMKIVFLSLDPYTNFFIKKIPEHTPSGGKTLEWAVDELEKLSTRQLTGHAGIDHLRFILSNLNADDANVISRVIGKDLRCGMADGLVNSIVPGFIPSYPCLLARPYDDKNIKNISYPAFSQLKADGVRVNFHVNGGKVFICGRSGREIDLLGHMDDAFIKLGSQFSVPGVFDGELVVVDDSGKILSRKIGNGIINKAIKGTISDDEAKMVRAQLWDFIPLNEFKAGISNEPYEKRFESLIVGIDAAGPVECEKKYWPISFRVVNNLEEAQEHFQEMLSAGQEGTILKNFCGLWEDTRSKHLVKFKAERDCDLEIVGWNEGTGKFLGMVGSLNMASSDRLVEAAISGFPDDLRVWITENIDSLIGTIATVTYNERIKSRDRPNIDSLFLPRFDTLRNDKKVADSSSEIK